MDKYEQQVVEEFEAWWHSNGDRYIEEAVRLFPDDGVKQSAVVLMAAYAAGRFDESETQRRRN